MLAVHSDRKHIHTHIVFNNTNLYNGLSFTTEHNQGRKNERAWAELRQISDELCRENGLSVISQPEKGQGVSYYEYAHQKIGTSWKDKLRAKIAEVTLYSRDFQDFLQKCTECGIEYVYKPQNKVKLKFRLSGEGQQKFTRADTLGADFTAERIAEQIAEIQKAKAVTEGFAEKKKSEKSVAPPMPTVTPKTEPTPTATTPTKPTVPKNDYVYKPHTEEELDRIFGTSSEKDEPESNLSVMTEEEYIKILNEQDRQIQAEKEKTAAPPTDPWADIRGMGRANEIIADLEAGGVTSYRVLASFFFKGEHPDDHTDELAELKKKFTAIDTLIAKMKKCVELAPVYKEYKSKSGWGQSRFKKKNADKIEEYEQNVKYIKEHRQPYLVDGKLPTMLDLMGKSNELKAKYNSLISEHTAFVTKRDTAKKYTRQVRNYLSEEHNRREREQSRQRTQAKHRNKNTLE